MVSSDTKGRWHRAIACRIKALRRAAGLTQEQTAEKAEIAPQYLSRVENVQHIPSLDTIIGLAEALGTTPSALLADPQEDASGERMSRVAAMFSMLTEEDAAFVEAQIAALMSYLRQRGAQG